MPAPSWWMGCFASEPCCRRTRNTSTCCACSSPSAVTALALGLVLFSAFLHASWNYLLKKSGGGQGLVSLASLLSLVVYAPFVIPLALWTGYRPAPIHFGLMFASGVIHTFYFLLLDRAYRSGGDLS